MISTIIVAAGNSTRMNMGKSKQYIPINNIPVLARSIKTFESISLIDEIIVVVNQSDINYCKEKIIGPQNFCKIKSIVAGGNNRQQSVFNGIKEASSSSDIIVIHDGARPFVKSDTIKKTIDTAKENSSATCAVRVKDTIKISSKENFVTKTIPREFLWSIQTPQAFKKDIIVESHQKAISDQFLGTDDTALVERLGIKTKIVEGDYFNIKITTKEDLTFADAILNPSFN